jgi:elongation factor Ts
MKDVTAEMVMELRKKTGAGIMLCKDALKNSEDTKGALIFLREKSNLDLIRKNSSNNNGLIEILACKNIIVMFSLVCETDFVAKSVKFKKLSKKISEEMLVLDIQENKKMNGDYFSSSSLKTKFRIINNIISDGIIAFGEKIKIKEFIKINSANIHSFYIHSNKKVGSLCLINYDGKVNKYFLEISKDLSMHIAALSPKFLNKKDITEDELKIQKLIFRKQASIKSNSNRIVDFIVESKISKYFSEVCLMNQIFVKDKNVTVKKFINIASDLLGKEIQIIDFYVFKI